MKMKTMKIPGFTAENSLYKTRARYDVATAFESQNDSANVEPALRRICDVLSELVWGAYNEGAYNRAEFWEGVMGRAGCFD
jgi:hypothetical protein